MSVDKRKSTPALNQKKITRRELVELLNAFVNCLDPRKLKIMAKCAGYNVDVYLALQMRAAEMLKKLSEDG
jgi:hypothetical protein